MPSCASRAVSLSYMDAPWNNVLAVCFCRKSVQKDTWRQNKSLNRSGGWVRNPKSISLTAARLAPSFCLTSGA